MYAAVQAAAGACGAASSRCFGFRFARSTQQHLFVIRRRSLPLHDCTVYMPQLQGALKMLSCDCADSARSWWSSCSTPQRALRR